MKLQKISFRVFVLIAVLTLPFSNVYAVNDPTNEGVATASEVFVIYNSSYSTDSDSDSVQDSLELANYYRDTRSIPSGNVAGVAMPTTEAISRSDYNTYVKAGIEAAITNAGVADTIKYLVLVKGVPLKIQDTSGVATNYSNYSGNYASVDSSLTLLYQSYNNTGHVYNPYYNLDATRSLTYRFKPNTFIDTGYGGDTPTETTLKYLVTRLDGYTVADVKGMIDRAYNADTSGNGYYVVDGYNTTGWSYLEGSGTTSILSGMSKNFHPSPYSVGSSSITSAPGSVIGYTSYGTYGSFTNDFYNTLSFSYLNGAVANTYESFSGYSMRSIPTSFTNHSQIASFIHAGGTGGMGTVYEPYSDSLGRESIWMPAYAAGYTWADAAYMSLRFLDWQTVVLGDPLMRINIDIVKPTVTTGSSSIVTATSADLSGNVTNTGGQSNSSQGFQYGLTTAYGQSVSNSGTIGTGSYGITTGPLICNSTYHYRAYSVNTTGTGYGSDATFTTSACVNPGVSIATASSITTTTATLNGAITENGANTPTNRGFHYGTTNSYGSTSSTTGSYSAGAYTSNITGLSCNTTYHYRSFATSTSGTGYSNDLTFTTSPCVPTTTTESSSLVAGTTATLSGKITATGGINPTVRGFEYGPTTGYGSTTTETGSFVGSSGLTYTASLTGLTCESVYHYRSYATNSTGTGYGSDATFTTGACVYTPTLTTGASASVTTNSATLSGTLDSTGGENLTTRGFNYGTTDSYGTNSTQTGSFNVALGYISKIGASGTGDGQFASPRDVAIDSQGNIYVADRENHRIQKFDSSGTYITQWGSFGTGNGQFKYPRGIAIDSSDNIYVADCDNYRIQKFTSAGVYVTKWGNYSTGNGGLKYVSDVMIDGSNNVYASDLFDNYRVNKFNTSGTYVTKWGSQGSGNSQFNVPYALAADSSGNVYVVDSGNNRIQKFNSSGVYQSQFGSYGSGNGQLNAPSGIEIDSSGNIYVSDSGNSRIQKFDSSGNYLAQFGSSGTGNGQFNDPQGIEIDSNGDIYIADYSNQRIQKFSGGSTYTINITGLSCNTTYHYRAYGANSGGNGYGSDSTFTTSACNTPTLTTSTATNITTTTATLNGDITLAGLSSSTIRGFNYGPDTNYGDTTVENGTFSTGAYTADITGLTCGTTYHYNAYATNGSGTGSSSDDTFTTSDCPDVTSPVLSLIASSVSTTSATITWTTDESSSTSISYGSTSSYGTTTTETDTSPMVTSHSVSITGLTCNTTYHYTVISKDLSNNTSSDIDHTFTTSSCPVVSQNNGGGGGGGGGGVSGIAKPTVPLILNTVKVVGLSRESVNKFISSKTIKVGAKGEPVQVLQKLMQSAGPEYLLPTEKADGIFGKKTKLAVQKFQIKNNLTPDGVVGPKTKSIIDPLNPLKFCYATDLNIKQCK